MRCKKIETGLVAYLDGRATDRERREVEAHLPTCSECRKRAEEFRLLWGVLDRVPVQEPSPAFDARLRARVAREPAPRGMFGWLVPSPRLAVVVPLLLLLSVWISSLPPAHTPERPLAAGMNPEAEFRMIRDLPVLENYDVLANFEALSEIPPSENGEM